jgi:hypothetical protein
MAKIYVFAIGGTGSRVLRALTMLLASGVECEADTIVPIIIDPDAAAGDVTRTVELMKRYGEIRSKLDFVSRKKNMFFKTDIQQTMPNFRLPLSNTENITFADYMGVNGMSRENQALANMLFSQKNLASDMKVGFKGNPNVGSVVLNQFDDSGEFKNFSEKFTDQDKIFIISSIFGGTGASGFPLLLKTLRTSDELVNQNYVRNAHIGAISVLPYFQVKQDENSQIDSTTFVSKAKSALDYYYRTISRNNANDRIDSLYYIADNIYSVYSNCEGGVNQQNKAHFMELISALALLDFASSKKKDKTVHKEFGIETNSETGTDPREITFDNLGKISKPILRKAMTQFLLFAKYLDENNNFLAFPWSKKHALDKAFFDSDFIHTLKQVQKEYVLWLDDMASQKQRAFKPFNLHKDKSRVFDLLKDKSPNKLLTLDSNYNLFNNRLNRQGKSKSGEKEQQLMELFYMTTQKLVKEKFNIE